MNCHFSCSGNQIGCGIRATAPRLGAFGLLSTIKKLGVLGGAVVVPQLGKLDLASPAGKLMLAMLATAAAMERDLIVERPQTGLARAKAE